MVENIFKDVATQELLQDWEMVSKGGRANTAWDLYTFRVRGGHLYRYREGLDVNITITFVPDVNAS
jgi:hypothetical protein